MDPTTQGAAGALDALASLFFGHPGFAPSLVLLGCYLHFTAKTRPVLVRVLALVDACADKLGISHDERKASEAEAEALVPKAPESLGGVLDSAARIARGGAPLVLLGVLLVASGCASSDSARAFERARQSAVTWREGYAALRSATTLEPRPGESVAAVASLAQLLEARLEAHVALLEAARAPGGRAVSLADEIERQGRELGRDRSEAAAQLEAAALVSRLEALPVTLARGVLEALAILAAQEAGPLAGALAARARAALGKLR